MNPDISEALKCSGCNVCLNECPVYEHYRCEAFGSRGKMEMLRLWESGQIRIEEMAGIFEACTVCKRCENVCTQGIGTSAVFRDVRSHLVKQRINSHSFEAIRNRINETGSPYSNGHIVVPDGYKTNRKGTLLWLGCTARHLGLAQRWLEFLAKLDYMPSLLESENCCGSFLNNCGYREDYNQAVERNMSVLSQYKSIVTLCPSCYSVFRNERRASSILFITEVLERFEKRLHISKSIKKPVLIFEPCHLRNSFPKEKFTDSIVKIFEKDGCEHMLSSDLFGAKCCGSGGGLFVSSPEIPIKNTRRILDETGAGSIVTMCPFCYRAFNSVTDDVMQVVEVLSVD